MASGQHYSMLIDDLGDAEHIDDLFLLNLYVYYIRGGYYNIMIDDLTNIITSTFLMFFLNFLYMCVDFAGLFTNTGNHSITEYIHLSHFWHLDGFMIICLVIFFCYIALRIFRLISDIYKFQVIRRFYNEKFHIQDVELKTYHWDDIVTELMSNCYNTSGLDVYTVSNRIMKMDNILIALYDQDILNVSYLSQLMEWNIRYCFIHSLQKNTNQISPELIANPAMFLHIVQTRLIVVTVINLIFMPFILLFTTFYQIIDYGESFYNSPILITKRCWTNRSKWRFRFYNELPHLFNSRMELASVEMDEYLAQFNYRLLEIISRFIVFVFSSLFLFLLVIVFINENNLTNKGFFGFQPVLWYITVFATIIAIFRKYTKSNMLPHPEESLRKVNQHLHLITDSELETAGSHEVKRKMDNQYSYQIVILFKELFFILLAPIDMCRLYWNSTTIVNYITQNVKDDYDLGFVVDNSIFIGRDLDIIQNKKVSKSLDVFCDMFPKWTPDDFIPKATPYHYEDETEKYAGNDDIVIEIDES